MLKRRKVFAVYVKETDEYPMETARYIPQSFSLLAFFIPPVWAFLNNMWILGIAIMAFFMLNAGAFNVGIPDQLSFAMELGFRVWIACQASDILEWKAKRKGYVLYDIVAGESEEEAQQRLLDRTMYSRRKQTDLTFA